MQASQRGIAGLSDQQQMLCMATNRTWHISCQRSTLYSRWWRGRRTALRRPELHNKGGRRDVSTLVVIMMHLTLPDNSLQPNYRPA
jgi:hypothetical protein